MKNNSNSQQPNQKKSSSKENLNWKINYLAVQIGEDSRLKSAKKAATVKLQHQQQWAASQGYPSYNSENNKVTLRHMLDEARGKKLELKLFQAQKELRSALKKSKVVETQKQLKKLRDSRKLVADASKTQESNAETKSDEAQSEEVKSEETKSEETKSEVKPKKGRVVTPELIAKMEKELEIVKNLDVDTLAEKTLRNKLLKHSKLKQSELLVSVVNSYEEYKPPTETPEDPVSVKLTQDIETRVLSNKVAKDELTKLMVEIELIVIGTPSQLKPGKPSSSTATNGKRSAENEHLDSETNKTKKQKSSVSDGSSLFVETLKEDSEDDDDESDDEDKDNKAKSKSKDKKSLKGKDWVDTDFNKYYENEEKKNRPGQRQRRIVWEQMYGKTAKHLAGKRKDNQKGGKPKAGAKPSISAPASKPKDSGFLEDDEMHPSWQAKRLQQEMMSKALSGEGSSNKKIVFDTDD
ncbi:hypothetical protein F4703DRAFT_1893887 [Phycomyces blakesleeanus]